MLNEQNLVDRKKKCNCTKMCHVIWWTKFCKVNNIFGASKISDIFGLSQFSPEKNSEGQ